MQKTILIIEDETEMIELLTIELENENFKVISASDGEEGYQVYLQENPDLIILDVMLPKLNGFEVCRKIRRETGDEITPILMLTAKAEDVDKIVGKVIGAEKYITKPFENEELLEEIRNLLDL